VLRAVPIAFILTMLAAAQQTVSFPTKDAVILAPGGRFNKESWKEQAQVLATKGFRILAIDFRGFGCSTGPGQADFFSAPFPNDVLAAVGYLKSHGAKTVSVAGASFGGGAAEMHPSWVRQEKLIASYFWAQHRTSPRKG
jgi:pimeloyl-ACP methyl ester carboxylesterase